MYVKIIKKINNPIKDNESKRIVENEEFSKQEEILMNKLYSLLNENKGILDENKGFLCRELPLKYFKDGYKNDTIIGRLFKCRLLKRHLKDIYNNDIYSNNEPDFIKEISSFNEICIYVYKLSDMYTEIIENDKIKGENIDKKIEIKKNENNVSINLKDLEKRISIIEETVKELRNEVNSMNRFFRR